LDTPGNIAKRRRRRLTLFVATAVVAANHAWRGLPAYYLPLVNPDESCESRRTARSDPNWYRLDLQKLLVAHISILLSKTMIQPGAILTLLKVTKESASP
jgi:hypothetical protein